MNKKVSIIVLLGTFFVLGGCISAVPSRLVSFDNYQLTIPSIFEELNAQSVSNKLLTNQIIGIYRMREEDTTLFEKNIIIAIALNNKLTTQQFAQGHQIKIGKNLFGYEFLGTLQFTFVCKDSTIDVIVHEFQRKERIGSGSPVFVSQAMFVKGVKGYILSAASTDQSDLSSFVSYRKTLTCSSSTTPTT